MTALHNESAVLGYKVNMFVYVCETNARKQVRFFSPAVF